MDKLSSASVQVLDRLCASHLYREAIVCEKRDAGSEAPENALQLAIVLQNSYHEMPVIIQENPETAHDSSRKPASCSTAVQRLAALSVGSGQVPPSASGSKRHAHRRKKVSVPRMNNAPCLPHTCLSCLIRAFGVVQKAQPQRVVRLECNGLHVSLISRFVLDCAYFGKEVVAMKNALVGSSQRQQACSPQQLGYKTITEVKAHSQ